MKTSSKEQWAKDWATHRPYYVQRLKHFAHRIENEQAEPWLYETFRAYQNVIQKNDQEFGYVETGQEQESKVDHPPHYTQHPSGVECIEIVRHFNFNLGNVIKYVWRAGLKSGESGVEDLKKAKWYLEDEIARVEVIDETPVR